MPDMKTTTSIVSAGDESAGVHSFSHPWNEKSEITMNQLARRTGMSRAIVIKAVIPPGKESFVYHAHHRDEEWVYILNGNGTAEIDGQDYPVSAGDFLGFPTPSKAHHLRNTGTIDLTILMGGEAHEIEIADFPKLGKRKLTMGTDTQIVELPEK